MNFLKLLIILVFLQGFSSFAIIHKEDCEHKHIQIENVEQDPLDLSAEFMDILKEFNWDRDENGDIVTTALGVVELNKLCGQIYDLNIANAPKSWKNSSVVTPDSARKIAIRLNACLGGG